jgi:hypothetical protein
MKLSHEPAITATVTAGLTTAIGVGAALNAIDLPRGWDWAETVLPVVIFVAYLIVGLVIRPLVVPTAKLRAEGLPVPDGSDAERLADRDRRIARADLDPGPAPGAHRRVRRPGDD